MRMLIREKPLVINFIRRKFLAIKPTFGKIRVRSLIFEKMSSSIILFNIQINKSFSMGVLPKDWCHAIVTPIFKKGNKLSYNNFIVQ